MAWNSENNYAFATAVLCAEQRRQAAFWKAHFVALGETWQYNFNLCFSSPVQDDFAPNVGAEIYTSYIFGLSDDPEKYIGPSWSTIPGGGAWWFDGPSYFGTAQKTLLDKLDRVAKWEEQPTLQQFVDAFTAQVSTDVENEFPLFQPDRWWKPEFLSHVRQREKKLWEFDPVINAPDRVQLYMGRVQPDQAEVTPAGEYIDAFFLIEPWGEAGIRCWKLKCVGCCCCC